MRALGHARGMLPLHLGVARITALIPLAPWVALATVIPLIALVTLVTLVALVALVPLAALVALITVIAGLRLGQPQGRADNAHQGEPADGSCNGGVHGIPFCCNKRALR